MYVKVTPEPVVTGDGSLTLYDERTGQHYHSLHGARQESQHVFIAAGLESVARAQKIALFELGFGTGLNAYLSKQWSTKHERHVAYTGIELHPLSKHWSNQVVDQEWKEILLAEWNKHVQLTPFFSLRKEAGNVLERPLDNAAFDLIYHDAFSPEAQPELWSAELFAKFYDALRPGGVWVSYSAKGQVRRDLQSVGFDVERIPGPPGKREMLRASKL